jgi:hypothetical protein
MAKARSRAKWAGIRIQPRYWQYHFVRVQRGRDLAAPANDTLTRLGFSGWEAYAVQPDPLPTGGARQEGEHDQARQSNAQ